MDTQSRQNWVAWKRKTQVQTLLLTQRALLLTEIT